MKLILILVLFSVAAIAGCTGNGETTTTAPTAEPPATAPESTTKPPTADAGDDQTVEAGNTVSYDASGSSDPEGGSIVSYEWKVVGAPSGQEDAIGSAVYSGSDAKWTTSWIMKPDAVGQWTMELKVTDDEGDTAVDSMVLTVTEATTEIDGDLLLGDDGS